MAGMAFCLGQTILFLGDLEGLNSIKNGLGLETRLPTNGWQCNRTKPFVLVLMYAKSVANANNDHLTLSRSLLEGGYMGVRLGGTGIMALPKEVGGRILNNIFRNQGTKAILGNRATR